MTPKSNLKLTTLKHPLDRWWQLTIIKFLPRAITPNLLSIIRLMLIPVVLGLIYWHQYPASLLLFLLIALTDSLDGALARSRQTITNLGLILDPLADKLLIGSTLAILAFTYPFPDLIIYLITFELIILIFIFVQIKLRGGSAFPANLWGKLKMVGQSLAAITILLWLIFPTPMLLYFSALLLLLTLLFLILSALPTLKKLN